MYVCYKLRRGICQYVALSAVVEVFLPLGIKIETIDKCFVWV